MGQYVLPLAYASPIEKEPAVRIVDSKEEESLKEFRAHER